MKRVAVFSNDLSSETDFKSVLKELTERFIEPGKNLLFTQDNIIDMIGSKEGRCLNLADVLSAFHATFNSLKVLLPLIEENEQFSAKLTFAIGGFEPAVVEKDIVRRETILSMMIAMAMAADDCAEWLKKFGVFLEEEIYTAIEEVKNRAVFCLTKNFAS